MVRSAREQPYAGAAAASAGRTRIHPHADSIRTLKEAPVRYPSSRRLIGLTLLGLAWPLAAAGQSPAPPAPPPPPTPAAQSAEPDPDLSLVLGEPEFTLSTLPTSLRMPSGKFAFRMTHRFTRTIGEGSVGDFFADFFGFDSSSRVGLEFRHGIRPGTQLVFHRTNDRSIQLLGQHELVRQSDSSPLTIDLLGGVEGLNNLSEEFGGIFGGIVARRFGDQGAIYAHPMVVTNTNFDPAGTGDDHTVLLGLGARIRIGKSRGYIVVEAAPRIAGFDPGVHHVSLAIEKRAGGHVFQLNISNSLGTTMRQIARGGVDNSDWFVGFNLTRRFF